jgi:D-serine deaminase-like pyridoxal phosphate-dependent protein
MLNKTKFALVGVVAAAAMASTGAQAATQTASAEVDIVAAVQLAQNDGLDFGVVASSGTAGTVVLPTASNTRVCSAGVTCVGTALRGRFTVSGATTGYVVAINVPATTTLASGGNNMVLTLAPSMTSFTSAGAPQIFFVGGSLAVGANQAAGTYTGSYNVSADYQ